MSTWRELIGYILDGDVLIANTLTDEEMDIDFDDGYGGHQGKPFTAWSEAMVYFPVVYDGAEWVGRAPRNPCDIATCHVGGE